MTPKTPFLFEFLWEFMNAEKGYYSNPGWHNRIESFQWRPILRTKIALANLKHKNGWASWRGIPVGKLSVNLPVWKPGSRPEVCVAGNFRPVKKGKR